MQEIEWVLLHFVHCHLKLLLFFFFNFYVRFYPIILKVRFDFDCCFSNNKFNFTHEGFYIIYGKNKEFNYFVFLFTLASSIESVIVLFYVSFQILNHVHGSWLESHSFSIFCYLLFNFSLCPLQLPSIYLLSYLFFSFSVSFIFCHSSYQSYSLSISISLIILVSSWIYYSSWFVYRFQPPSLQIF